MEEDVLEDIDIEIVFGTVTGHAYRAISRQLTRGFRMAKLNLTPEQWSILLVLSREDGLAQQELAKMTYRDKPGITRILLNMEKRNLIRRKIDLTDKRTNRVYITDEGKNIKAAAKAIVIDTIKIALGDITEEEINIGQRLLKKIFRNLSINEKDGERFAILQEENI
jgi:DNA-binding MarR family transcriptional regulator